MFQIDLFSTDLYLKLFTGIHNGSQSVGHGTDSLISIQSPQIPLPALVCFLISVCCGLCSNAASNNSPNCCTCNVSSLPLHDGK